MKILVVSGNLLLLLGSSFSSLQQPWIAGYEPLTFVSDYAAIDLDQRAIEKWVGADTLQQVERVYIKGGHSQSIAQLRLVNPKPPADSFPAGTLVHGIAVNGDDVQGRLVKETFWTKEEEQVVILVEYDRERSPELFSHCQVGALAATNSSVVNGCFIAAGEVWFLQYAPNIPVYGYNYTYDIGTDNINGRTIQGFSTMAFDEMRNCTTCPYETYMKYENYYGIPDYGDRFVQAALQGTGTNFSLNGNLDFSKTSGKGRGGAIKIATSFLNIWMYVIRMMELALDQCEMPCEKTGNVLYTEAQKVHCDDSPVRSWDQAVALYAGSLEGESGAGEGLLLFNLADSMCSRFMSCGDDAELRFGVSYTNNMVINEFMKGQIHLLKRECGLARESKNTIVKLMAVPLVQATLLNTFHQVYGVGKILDEEDQANLLVEGSVYAATVLPLVHDCSPSDAQFIYESLLFESRGNTTQYVPDFVQVKNAFERNYKCMGITCKSVGGIWQGRVYFSFADPCQDDVDTDSSNLQIGLAIGAVGAGLVICAIVFLEYKRYKISPDIKPYETEASTVPEFSTGRSID